MSRLFGHWLKEYVNFTQHSEAPDQFHFWTGVSVIAGALRRQVWIDQRYFTWTPNFYIILVGPPGIATKSTTVRIGHSLLREIEGINFGPSSMTWQGLTDALANSCEGVDITGNGEYVPMSCITCSINELGTFLQPSEKQLVDLLVDMWDGQDDVWRRHTKGIEGRVEIINPWINVIACTTPAWLRDNFPESMIGGGLTSRIIFIYGDHKRRLVPYPADEIDVDAFNTYKEQLISDLKQIAQIKGSYEITSEAKEWGAAWYEDLWTNRPKHMASDRFGGYISRKQTHIHKLGIVLAASESDERVVTREHLQQANRLVTALEVDMQRVFESIGVVDSQRCILEMLAYVKVYKGITQQELWRMCMPVMSLQQFKDAQSAAVQAGHLSIRQVGNEIKCYYLKVEKRDDAT